MSHSTVLRVGIVGLAVALLGIRSASVQSDTVYFAGSPPTIAQTPLYLDDAVPPLNMLVMGKDHKIYYEAYNDASDLDGDGILDVGYRGFELKNPAPTDGSSRFKIDYYGYFNSYACYSWQTDRFVPVAAAPNKTCSGSWSGDFLNYLTMSRMDALRRVLYGGWRQVDTQDETILQGAFFPQDAHSWGKEYQSIERDGYDIRDYAPLPLPAPNKYHLFAVTTVSDSSAGFPDYTAPMFRVLQNSDFRVWNWLSIEGPVAGNRCFNASNTRVDCVNNAAASWQLVPSSALQNLQISTWRRPNNVGSPADLAGMNDLFNQYAVSSRLCGSGTVTQINKTNSGNPFTGNSCGHDNYLTRITGQIVIPADGTYRFAVDGDDAVDLFIDGNHVVGWYGGHANDRSNGGLNSHSASVTLSAGVHTIEFRHEEATGDDSWGLFWQDSSSAASRQDYLVRVQACRGGDAYADLRESVCKAYGTADNPIYKPTGILHDYGETRKMFFGLITGSQANNLEGGVLRSNIEDFNREIDPDTGIFRANVEGIVRSIDRLRMIGGGYNSGVTNNLNGDTNWNWANTAHGVGGNCESQGGRALRNGECRMWGNPIAEMLYEGLRYFAGAATPTTRFSSGGSSQGQAEDNRLGLPAPAWRDPYSDTVVDGVTTHTAYPSCARPHMTIISDINPSYDGDLPGSAFEDAITTVNNTPATISGFNAAEEGAAIWNAEFGGPQTVFIGEVLGDGGVLVNDGAPTAKTASSFGTIRGLSPEEPTKRGTYYSASVARFGRNTDVNPAPGNQNVNTYSIALASPLPQIAFPVGGRWVTLLPFAKTVSGTFGENPIKPTNTIVDFYVEDFQNFPGQPVNPAVNGGRPSAVFRINYEDVEQGNDHDMDMIVRYQVVANADNTVTVTLDSEYAAGSANQNAGYVISGTTQDGVYLEVRDRDSAQNTSVYELNTPSGVWAGGCIGATNTWPCNQGLGLASTRTFTPGDAGRGVQLRDPLWYAAKYGSPTPTAWDADGDGDPDNYFLVTNPLNLRAQLSRAFDDIASYSIDAGSQTLTGARVGSGSFTLVPSFQRDRDGKDWFGNLSAVAITPEGTLVDTELWNAQAKLPAHGSRRIHTVVQPGANNAVQAVEFRGDNTNLGPDDPSKLARLGITGSLSTLPNAYGAVYDAAAIVDYLRGDQSRESGRPGVGNTLRARTSVLGDIVNSEPVIASPRSDFGYGSFNDPMFSGYAGENGYLEQKASRPTVVYVGANDGMLHAFNGNTVPCDAGDPNSVACAHPAAGSEMFAFIPQESLRRMGALALPDSLYEHRYYVDGQLMVTDAKDATGAWRTVLVGSMGGGGRSVFALDVSNPEGFGNGSVLWELNSSVDQDIGHVYGRPLLLPLENDRWGVLFGNGYGGNTSDPSLYVVDAFTGQLIAKLTADDGHRASNAGTPLSNWICSVTGLLCAEVDHPFNGLGQITAIDRDGNGKADTVYGGDLQGNVWKFDLSGDSAANWEVALGGQPLVTAIASNGERQPVTGGLRVSAGPGSGVMVYFGTGRYFLDGDNEIPQEPDVQSLYGVFDNDTPIVIADETQKDVVLQRQWIQAEVETNIDTDGDGVNDTRTVTRNISRNRVSYYGPNAKRGWYLDLVVDNEDGTASGTDLRPEGERFIATPRIQSGRVFFTTFSPTGDSCDPGGTNIVYALDLLSGSGALSNVRSVGSEAAACTGPNCGAVQIPEGGAPITSTSVAAINPTRYVTNPACTPGVDCPTFEECQVVIYPGAFVLPRPCGRQSWRQLR